MNEPFADSATASNTADWSVSEISGALKRTVEDAFGHVRVRGEISGFRGQHSSGHAYFSLKDASARLDAVVWKGNFGRLKVKPEEGLEVIAIGRITTFPGKSSYQIVIEQIEYAGAGAIMAMLEERKRRLAGEGLFAAERKRRPPFLPTVIGVVTSPTGAVIRDILHRLNDRFPRRVLVWPVRVQGDTCGAEVAAAIRGFNALPAGGLALASGGRLPRPDVLIVARGGGSLEDLLGFSEEEVVRAAAESRIPLISAVGHETDVTLIDFAADVRAPTPTAAAEMAVPVRAELVANVESLRARLRSCVSRGQDRRRADLRALARHLPRAEDLLAVPRQRLDIAGHRLPRALRANASAHRLVLARVEARFGPARLEALVARRRERFDALSGRLGLAFRTSTDAHRQRLARWRDRVSATEARLAPALMRAMARRREGLAACAKLLDALSYQGVLARGFALVRDASGAPVRLAASLAAGDGIDIQFADGRVPATVGKSVGSTAAAPRPSRKKASKGGEGGNDLQPVPLQPTLFER